MRFAPGEVVVIGNRSGSTLAGKRGRIDKPMSSGYAVFLDGEPESIYFHEKELEAADAMQASGAE